jgi:hypothetical protein
MTMAAEALLLTRARRAYEAGRVLLGLRRSAAVVPMAGLSVVACGRPWATAAVAALLLAAVVLFEWRGEGVGRGARVGLLAGIPPLLLPLVLRGTMHACSATFCLSYSAACLASGVVAGVAIGLWTVRRGVRGRGVAAAGLVAVLAGSLGCLIAGLGGLGGLALGLGLGAAPLLALRRA